MFLLILGKAVIKMMAVFSDPFVSFSKLSIAVVLHSHKVMETLGPAPSGKAGRN